jgi:hypothetical protein
MPNPFGALYTLDFVVLVVCAVAWFRAAKIEDVPPWNWVGLSVLMYWITWRWLGWGIIGGLAGQGLLVLLIAVGRVIRESRNGDDSSKSP